jgi:uncharacterized RDD family membrane protein YckC
MERIGFGPRLGAMLIDFLIIIVGMSILGILFGLGSFGLLAGGSVTGFSIGMILISLIPIAYSYTDVLMAATPGKKALKLVIRNEDGSEAEQQTLIKRWAFKNSSFMLQFLTALTTVKLFSTLGGLAGLVVFIGCFFVLGEARQAFHDKFAKTAVFRAPE